MGGSDEYIVSLYVVMTTSRTKKAELYRGSQQDKPETHGLRDRIRSARGIELCRNGSHVKLGSVEGDLEPSGDQLVGGALC